MRGKELLAVLFPLFSALLVWPLLTVANRPVLVAGIPSLVLAATRGLEFLTIHLGPALVALLWPTVLRKLVRVAKEQPGGRGDRGESQSRVAGGIRSAPMRAPTGDATRR